ncbi:MAG: prepilin peptidase [Patescibacteria group bacterium]|nr:prepilin peptidase [Patescibacteria group bacterium]MDE2589050.1 prepilin peptidase [Patescibacteria group bacterium]
MIGLIVLIFIAGVAFGSFFNVVIDRVPREETFFTGRSHCDFCKHTLAWYDLIPLLSFLLLGGRCRYCKKFIGFKYPLVEVTTGLFFIILLFPLVGQIISQTLVFSSVITTLFTLVVFSAFIIIFYTDLWYGIIPDIVLFPATIVALFSILISQPYHIVAHVISAVAAMGFFLALFLGTRGKGMGFGDVKLAFFLGLLLGWPGTFLAIYVAFLTGAIAALILVLWGRKRFFGSTIPFGPFLILGTLISWFWAPFLWEKILALL